LIEQRVDAAGLPLCLCRWGPGSTGLPVLVLHGFLEQGAAWDAVGQRLARALGRPVVAPDHRGHGRSGHVAPSGFYHFWDYVADVQAVVDALGGRVDLVGHSMGGTMACLFAGSRPEAVRRLVLVEGLGPPALESLARTLARQYLNARREPPRHPVMADRRAAARRMQRYNKALTEAEALRLATRTTRAVPGGVTWSWDARHRARNPYPFQQRLFRQLVEAIEAPVLAIDGADSPFPDRAAGERRDWLADARHEVIADAGHLLHHDQPEVLAHVIGEFLAD